MQKLFRAWPVLLVSALVVGGLWIWPQPQRLEQDHSVRVLAKDGELLRAYLSQDEKWRFPVRSDQLPDLVTEGLLCLEDQRFFYHPGFDPLAFVRALWQNFYHRRIVSGASTITMQLARLLEPKPRTLVSKLYEVVRAFQIELFHSKKEILNLYLSYAPFGSNIEGIEAAAAKYFNKRAGELSIEELAFLYLLPQNPGRWGVEQVGGLKIERDRLLRRWQSCGAISDEQYENASLRPIPNYRHYTEVSAPHLADYLKVDQDGLPVHFTTIDFPLQVAVEEYLQRYQKHFYSRGIQNVGLIVVENATRKVRVLVGNFDYFVDEHSQKIASFKVHRSPGSALKPFLYAQMLENGYILPETLMRDVPTRYGEYQPQNYDGEYYGLVEAKQALAVSLNIPFVRGLRQVGLESFVNLLESGGIRKRFALKRLGLSMIIGAVELTLMDLASLYTNLARGGKAGFLQLTESERQVEDWNWIDPGAALLTAKALNIRLRPDLNLVANSSLFSKREIHWKTGTSQSRRDAWSIGFNQNYTVAVWLGNLNNHPSPSLVGAESAAPLMFDVFAMLPDTKKTESQQELSVWKHVQELEVCSYSGLPAGKDCPHIKVVRGVHGVVPEKQCPYHTKVLVDVDTGLRVHKSCPLRGELKSFLSLPADVLYWVRSRYPDLASIPPYHPSCKSQLVEPGGLSIFSPLKKTYRVFGSRSPMMIPLQLKSIAKPSEISCFLNGSQLKFADSMIDRFIRVKAGDHRLYCTDIAGRSGEVSFKVQ